MWFVRSAKIVSSVKLRRLQERWVNSGKRMTENQCSFIVVFCRSQRTLRRPWKKLKASINLLKPTGHMMHQQFNIQQLYVLPTLYLCVVYLSNEELNDLYSSPNIVRLIKSRKVRLAGHVARMEEGRGVHKVLVGKP